MMPGGMNPKQMQKMMKRMGISMEEIDATEVVIKTVDKDIIVENPQVVKTNVSGQDMYQVSGTTRIEEADVTLDISEDDVDMVVQQAGVDEEEARAALEAAGGDIAEAIMQLKQ